MKLIFAILIFIPFLAISQNEETSTKIYAVGISFSPDYCYRLLKPNNDANIKDEAKQRNSIEIPKFGFTTGVNFSMNLSKRLSVDIGVLYSEKGEIQKKHDLIYFVYEPLSPINVSYNYHYRYIDIPVKFNYSILQNRLKIYVSAGFSPNIFLSNAVTTYYEYNDGSKKTIEQKSAFTYYKYNIAVIGGFGIGYDLTKNISIKLEPTFRCSVTSIVDYPIKGYLYSVGLNTGVYYKF